MKTIVYKNAYLNEWTLINYKIQNRIKVLYKNGITKNIIFDIFLKKWEKLTTNNQSNYV